MRVGYKVISWCIQFHWQLDDESLFISLSTCCTLLMDITVSGTEWRFFILPDVGGKRMFLLTESLKKHLRHPASCKREMSFWGLSWNSWLHTWACNASVILESSVPLRPPDSSRSWITSEIFFHCLSLKRVSSQTGGTSLATTWKGQNNILL